LIPWRKRGVEKEAGSPDREQLFREIVLPHLDAAYNLARWLMHNPVEAQDVVQESCLRALRFFDGYQGGDAKAWLLAIVRNTCRSWQSRQTREWNVVPFDEAERHVADDAGGQEEKLAREEQVGVLHRCIEQLPTDFREVLVMRELEEMSYREIADATGLALGTVMSRLSRARKRLEDCATGTKEPAE
jgi:RNA polymerase sigma-70 factor (ECF subfamily)